MKQIEAIALGLERGDDYGTCDYCDEVWFYDGSGPAHCGECGNHEDHCDCYKHVTVLNMFDPDEPKYSVSDMFDRMEQHEGHFVEVVRYGTHDLCYNRAIECVDCYEVIFDIDNPYIDEGPPPNIEDDFSKGVYPNGMTVVGYPDRGTYNGESERYRPFSFDSANTSGKKRENPEAVQYSLGPCDCSE